MKYEVINRLSKDDLPQTSGVLVTTHLPFIISGKYLDYQEGEMVSTTLNELSVRSLANTYRKDFVKIYLNNEVYKYKLSELEISSKDRGTIKSIIYGVFGELINRHILKYFEGLKISLETNISLDNGFNLNLIANILLSLNTLYDLNLKNSDLAEITQKVYIMYYGKTVSYLYCLTLYMDGINYYKMCKDKIDIEHLEQESKTFRYLLFENGPRLKANEYNNYYASLFELFKKVKEILHVNYLSEINYNKDFANLFSPTSKLLETEKLVLTHYIEENRRAPIIFDVFKHANNTKQALDAINMSMTELGAYCGFNNLKNFLDTTVYNASMNYPSAVTTVNDEILNMYVFISRSEDFEIMIRKINKYQNYFFYEVTPASEATSTYIIR